MQFVAGMKLYGANDAVGLGPQLIYVALQKVQGGHCYLHCPIEFGAGTSCTAAGMTRQSSCDAVGLHA